MSVFGWDYPAGVTGNEYEIAGPDDEKTITVDVRCEECVTDLDGIEIEAQFYRGSVWGDWVCPECGHENDWSGEAEDYR